MTFIKCYFKLS